MRILPAFAGNHGRAADFAGQSAALYGEWDATYIVLAAALAYAGRIEEARRAVAKLKTLLPRVSIAVVRDMVPVRDPQRLTLPHKTIGQDPLVMCCTRDVNALLCCAQIAQETNERECHREIYLVSRLTQ